MCGGIDGISMSSVIDVEDGHKNIVDRLDHTAFEQHHFVAPIHWLVFHVFANSGDQLQALLKVVFKEFGDIPLVAPFPHFHIDGIAGLIHPFQHIAPCRAFRIGTASHLYLAVGIEFRKTFGLGVGLHQAVTGPDFQQGARQGDRNLFALRKNKLFRSINRCRPAIFVPSPQSSPPINLFPHPHQQTLDQILVRRLPCNRI
jgi:hypothetical protein